VKRVNYLLDLLFCEQFDNIRFFLLHRRPTIEDSTFDNRQFAGTYLSADLPFRPYLYNLLGAKITVNPAADNNTPRGYIPPHLGLFADNDPVGADISLNDTVDADRTLRIDVTL